ncbi:CHAD domain-containing protein [Microbulbifer epialgicus]|uniref:CHAD domain-containing protein n=1 Tax=Microbulbifer epialgicus TaxID=393907 RepID=A0ABV4NWS0_9GAMM
MSYRLDCDLLPEHGLRLVAQAEVTTAISHTKRLLDEHAVHELRKHCKKLRALLRLVQPDHPLLFQSENIHYRNLAHSLAQSRDPVSIRGALLAIAPPHHFPTMHTLLRHMLYQKIDKRTLAQVELLLIKRRGRIESWSLEGVRWAHLERGYRRGYRRARSAWLQVQKVDSAETLHQLRKRVKDHWYHSRLLEEKFPQSAALRCEPLKQLAQALGDWRDIYLLCRLAIATGESLGKELIPILELGDWRKMRLRREIETLCSALFTRAKLKVD